MKVPTDMPNLESTWCVKCVSEEDKWWALLHIALKFGFRKMREISQLAQQLLAPKEGLSSIQLVNQWVSYVALY